MTDANIAAFGEDQTDDTKRLEALCDGVFAIAMTLLVLEIKVPHRDAMRSSADLWHAIGEAWPSLFAFALSFLIIFILWTSHHEGFKLIGRLSPAFVYANGFLLFVVALLPFPTALMAEYLMTDFAAPAVVVYCFACTLNNVAWAAVTEAQLRPRSLLRNPSDEAMIMRGRKFGVMVLGVSAGITLLAFWAPYVALSLNALTWIAALYVALAFPSWFEGTTQAGAHADAGVPAPQ